MGKTFDTALLGRIVSDIAGQEVHIGWCQKRDLPTGCLGAANWEKILLDEVLAKRGDPILPEVIFHEAGHVLLHKRVKDRTLEMTDAEIETEAKLFANEMLLRTGKAFIWDALTGDLDWAREAKLRAELEKVAALRVFKRNRIAAEPYKRASQSDVEVKHRGGHTAQHSSRQAQELEAQARREYSLAAKVTDPKLKAMIRNSATGKLERAEELKTGRPVETSKYETRLEFGQPVTKRK